MSEKINIAFYNVKEGSVRVEEYNLEDLATINFSKSGSHLFLKNGKDPENYLSLDKKDETYYFLNKEDAKLSEKELYEKIIYNKIESEELLITQLKRKDISHESTEYTGYYFSDITDGGFGWLTGTLKTFYMNGKINTHAEFDKDGVCTLNKGYYESGELKFQAFMKGEEAARYENYTKDGKLEEITHAIHFGNELHGENIKFKKDGGVEIKYWDHDEVVKSETLSKQQYEKRQEKQLEKPQKENLSEPEKLKGKMSSLIASIKRNVKLSKEKGIEK